MKKLKKLFSVKRVLALALVVCTMVLMTMPVLAANDASPAVATAREGVLQINLVYQDQNGGQHILKTGSGFLLGAASGATTVITNYHVVSLTDSEKEACTREYGADFFNLNNITIRIQIVVKRDVVIDASYINGSEKTDFAILELSQAIYDRHPLVVANSENVVETQRVYALGFPWITSAVSDDRVYTSSDVTITNGIVGKFQNVDSIKFILHDAALSYGNSGGPLVDSNGNVIGVNTMYTGEDGNNYSYSIAIKEIKEVMDALGIFYLYVDDENNIDTNSNQGNNNDSNIVDDGNTGGAGTSIGGSGTDISGSGTNTGGYTGGNNSGHDVDVVEDKSDNSLYVFGLIGIIILVIALIAVIIVVAVSGKKKNNGPQVVPGNNFVPTPPMQPAQPMQPMQPTVPVAPVPPMPPVFDSGAGETSVLGVGAGETSVLGGGSAQPTATLIRKKTGETVTIAKPSYSIGKERSKVDFCVPDNNSISRNHANIVCKGGVYYIVDNNSTNFTFVNGNKIAAGQEVRLNSGDKIKLADEEFEFRQ